ncbi:MAG: hypothetical protein ACRDG7_15430 [Candidatus Limnocylindria bacterium]
MIGHLLAGVPPGERALVVAGNLHTQLTPHRYGTPMGTRLAAARPGVLELRLSYGAGSHWNLGNRRLRGDRPPAAAGKHIAHPVPATVPVADER